jgi:hypothetical protein
MKVLFVKSAPPGLVEKKVVDKHGNVVTRYVKPGGHPGPHDFGPHKLPESNSNAKSHNAKVDKLQQHYDAGDIAGLQAMKFGVNTYGKQQAKLAATLVKKLQDHKDTAKPTEDAMHAAAAAEHKPVEHGKVYTVDSAKGDLSAEVVPATKGGYSVAVFDKDSGKYAPIAQTFPDLDAAKAYADKCVGKKAEPAEPEHEEAPALTLESAEKMGAAAHAAGQPGAPGADKAYMDALAKLNPAVGESAKYSKAWNKGWHEANAKAEAKPEAKPALPVHTFTHTQKGHDLHAVPLPAKVPDAKFKELQAEAKKLGGYWSSYSKGGAVAGFLFKDTDKAKEFSELAHAATAEAAPAAAPAAAAPPPAPKIKAARAIGKEESSEKQFFALVDKFEAAGDIGAMEKLLAEVKKHGNDLPPKVAATLESKLAAMKDAAAGNAAPAEGDTKVVDGVSYVLKNGRWHKAGPDAPLASKGAAEPEDADGWKKLEGQKGSNPGGLYEDAGGVKWYVKTPQSADHAKNELLAAKLYGLAGLAAQDAKLVELGGKLSIASKWENLKKVGAGVKGIKGAIDGFAVDAWLANWDVVGLGYDNLLVHEKGSAFRVDAGGALLYRAQGSAKGSAFGHNVTELNTLRDPSKAPQAAAVFGGMTPAEIKESAKRVQAMTPQMITDACVAYGPGDKLDRLELAATLIARRTSVLNQVGLPLHESKPQPAFKEAEAQKKPEPAKVDFEQHKLPASNSNAGTHNKKIEQIKALYEAGDAAGLQAMQFGKNTYNVKASKLAAGLAAQLGAGQPEPQAPENAAPTPKFETIVPAAPADPMEAAKKAGANWHAIGNSGIAGNDPVLMDLWHASGKDKKIIAAWDAGYDEAKSKAAANKDLVAADDKNAIDGYVENGQMQSLIEGKGWWQKIVDEGGNDYGGKAKAEQYVAAFNQGIEKLKARQAPAATKVKIGAQNLEHIAGKWVLNGGQSLPAYAPISVAASIVAGMRVPKGTMDSQDDGQKQFAVDLAVQGGADPDMAYQAVFGKPAHAAAAEPEPKEGDTKQEGGHTYVLKNGHWERVDEDKPVGPQDVAVPDFATIFGPKFPVKAKNWTAWAHKAKEKIVAAGPGIWKGAIKNYKDGKVSINVGGLKVTGYPASNPHVKAMQDYLLAIKEAHGAGGAPQPKKPAASAAPTESHEPVGHTPATKTAGGATVYNIAKWKDLGGGQFQDAGGAKWTVEFNDDKQEISRKHLENKFREMLGVPVSMSRLVEKNGKLGIAKKEGLLQAKLPEKLAESVKQVADAWFGGGEITKQFVADHKEAIEHFAKLKNEQINALVAACAIGEPEQKETLARTLKRRRAMLLERADVRDPWEEKKVDLTKIPVDPALMPDPIDFFKHPEKGGQPLSSKEHLNKQNTIDDAALINFAKKGNLQALLDYQYDAYDKESGASVGKKPITQHPAKDITNHWHSAIETLKAIAYPSVQGLDMPAIHGGSVQEVADAVGAFKFGETTTTISAEKRLGFFMKLGNVDVGDFEDIVPKKKANLTGSSAIVQKSKEAFKNLASATKAYIANIQSTGWINHVFSHGDKTVQASGNGGSYNGSVAGLAAAAYKDAVELPEGSVISRWMDEDKNAAGMVKMLLNEKPGMIFQNTDSMCCSYAEGWDKHSHFGSQMLLRIRYAKGAKALHTFASGNFGKEHEITTLPGARFMLLGVEKGNPSNASGCTLELLMLPPDEGFVADLDKQSKG